MAKYKHGQKFNVGFYGSLPRTQVITEQNGVQLAAPIQRPYFRLNFVLENEGYSVRCDKDCAGQAGTVMFVEAGQQLPDGSGTVARDGFSLVSLTTADTIAKAKEAQEAIKGFTW